MSTQNSPKTGVVLMTYGSATIAEHVAHYLESIYKGAAPESLVHEFENRYRLIGRSPLIEITQAQATALEKQLGDGYVVRAGMRHLAPSIEEAVGACRAAGANSIIGIILSPQFSSFTMQGYKTAFADAARKHGFSDDTITVAGPWPTEPHFIELLAKRTNESLGALHKQYGTSPTVVFTTHSLPQRVAERDPSYLEQLQNTIDAIRSQLDPKIKWYAGYQSAGHSPEEWLKPDLTDILAELHTQKASAVLIVPIQFLADHLEILYDLDIAAKQQCDEAGIAYHRIELPNADPLFIEALAAIAQATAGVQSSTHAI